MEGGKEREKESTSNDAGLTDPYSLSTFPARWHCPDGQHERQDVSVEKAEMLPISEVRGRAGRARTNAASRSGDQTMPTTEARDAREVSQTLSCLSRPDRKT